MPSSLNVSFVSESALHADAVHVMELARELARQGHRVTVHTRRQDESVKERTRPAARLAIEQLAAGPARPLGIAELLPHIKVFAAELGRRWTAGRPDIVHAHGWAGGLAAYAAAEGRDIPSVLSPHGLGIAERGKGGAAHHARVRMERALGRSVDTVIAGCPEEGEQLLRLGVERPKIKLVPYGVDVERFRDTGPAMPRGDRSRLVMVRRDLERGGGATAIRALVHIPDAELVLAGGPTREEVDSDPAVHRLRMVAKEVHVADRVIFLGRLSRKDVPKLLRTADLALCLDTRRASGTVPLEAMACGVPVVATPLGCNADIVLDKVTGLHVPPDRPTTTGRAIRALLAEPTTVSAYAIAAGDRARSRYAWERVAAETARLYARLLPADQPEEPVPAQDLSEAEQALLGTTV